MIKYNLVCTKNKKKESIQKQHKFPYINLCIHYKRLHNYKNYIQQFIICRGRRRDKNLSDTNT